MTITDLMNQVDSRQDELIEILTTLIRYETPAPPARNTKEAQNYVAKFLAQHNFTIDTWELYSNDPIVVGTKKGNHSQTHQSLIINGHIDVAEIQADEKWLTSPFEPVVTKNSVIGRGAADMKGGLAGSLFAIQLLQEAGIELKGDLILNR
ncbi:M20/M25/M40 family metallo-hydrolase [Vagococcus fluvialis]|uniref:M20/M25/M40 family metallo-hydrolase n=1 Tax=Vagococcus fluvialis TaxID=2738 RepID=UPI0022E5D667|nr:M20/M25/M40 family metallo-hydrolase [Vagococcus fluvialis]